MLARISGLPMGGILQLAPSPEKGVLASFLLKRLASLLVKSSASLLVKTLASSASFLANSAACIASFAASSLCSRSMMSAPLPSTWFPPPVAGSAVGSEEASWATFDPRLTETDGIIVESFRTRAENSTLPPPTIEEILRVIRCMELTKAR